MIRSPRSVFGLAAAFAVWGAAIAMSHSVPLDELAAKAAQLFRDGNFAEAYEGYATLCADPDADPDRVGGYLGAAVQCLIRIGRVNEIDAILESTTKTHAGNPWLLAAAASQYASIPHFGFRVAGNFERGPHRGGGDMVNANDRDRVQSIRRLRDALALDEVKTDATKHAALWDQLAESILEDRDGGQAWRLQQLTDFAQLPDYEPGYRYPGGESHAPVDASGEPVFHAVPAGWNEARSDGERWRWCLEQTQTIDPTRKNAARMRFATFLHGQFDTHTLRRYGAFWGREQDSMSSETGTFALHTLGDDETIARLATGVRRFALPDAFNCIKIFQAIADDPATGHGDDALRMLAQIFEDRRQYPRAATYWEKSIRRYGGKNDKQSRLEQIRGNWGQFEPVLTQPGGEGASVEFRFRNGKKVELEAQRINAEKLLQDARSLLKAGPRRIDWQAINVEELGWRLVNEGQSKYVGDPVARWTVDLQPSEGHFDKRITIPTPLRDAGAYLLKAKMEDGNTSFIVIWVADTAIVHKPLSDQTLYYVADARNGTPLAGMNVEFFGYRVVDRRGVSRVETLNFAEETDANGLLYLKQDRLSSEYQWLVVARGPKNRLAYLGFRGVWSGSAHDPEYSAVKAFIITDRPVYRPGQTAHFKAWFRSARYDRDQGSEFAGQNVIVRVYDPKGEELQSLALTADKHGGVAGSIELPAGATLGEYRVDTDLGTPTTFRVEEYKKPEYEVTVEAPKTPVMLGETITATIKANYYFGSPVTDATVKYRITRTGRTESWYPIMPWDWCFGPGYWWFAYDYPWYPGWSRWAGVTRPAGWWWPTMPQPPEIVAEGEMPIGTDGTVSVPIDTSLAKAMHADQDHEYAITAEVRDQSRRTIVGTGSVLVARRPFSVYVWVDRGHYRVGDTIAARILSQTLDQQPVAGPVRVRLMKITYDDARKPIETEVADWTATSDAEGLAALQVTASEMGQYRLACEVTDSQGHTIEGGYIFTVIGDGFDGARFRFNHIELIPDRADYQPGDTIRMQINTDQVGGTVLLFLRPTNGIYLPPQIVRLAGKSTIVDIPVTRRDMPNFLVEAMTVSHGRLHEEMKEIVVPPENRVLNVEVTPDRTEYKPGAKGTVKVRLTDFSGEAYVGSLVATMYDKSIEYISGGSNVADIREFFWKWRRHHNPTHGCSLDRSSSNLAKQNDETMQPIGVFGATVADELGKELGDAVATNGLVLARGVGGGFGGGGPGGAPMPMMAPSSAMADGAVAESDSGVGGAPGDAGGTLVAPTVRTNFADSAFWVGTLETNDQGVAELPIDMPENLTAWKIRVWGMGDGTRVGSGTSEVVTRKNLLLRMQTPRFAVRTDEVVLSANVHNYLGSAKDVVVTFEAPGDLLELLDPAERTIPIEANGEARVDWRVRVAREGTATVRMRALTDEESDAAQLTFPCHVHGILKTESWAGTVRPDQPLGGVSFEVPEARRAEQSRLEVRYSPSLAGAMTDALPYLLDYPYGCTEQTLNRFLPAVITQKILLEMNLDLASIRERRANLNAQEIGDDAKRAEGWKRYDREPVFDPAEMERIVKEGLARLTNMQNSDGGWGWFSGYHEQSYPHTTCVVVRGLQIAAANDVAIVPGVIEGGIEWLEAYERDQVRRIQNADGRIDPWKDHADDLDALVHHVLTESGRGDAEMRELLYRDRTKIGLYAKALIGLAFDRQGEADKVAMIVRNLNQYLVQDEENETAYLRTPGEGGWWFWYGDEIESQAAYLKLLARTDPRGVTAPRIVKYLLNNRKHATYWKSTRDTALCVEAFADFLRASGETRPDMTVEVWLDGAKRKEVAIDAANLFSFDNRFILAGEELASGSHRLEIRRRGTGPVYFNVYSTNFTLEDSIAAAGLEVKVQRTFYKLTRDDRQTDVAGTRGQVVGQRVEKYVRTKLESGAEIASGDLVEVELTIESKNDYEYVMFEDRKAAGFEPVELQSGYSTNGLGAYMELRDDRVAFFARQLARGRHSLSYRLRAEIPGAFSALPTQASAMYAPELKGNSDEAKLRIADAPE
ncbi:MAG: alpha-2-macroglobulin [Planctomycetes bacterium]|nr:alpha-2-macroglobulin [Planctomycetota bacterium]